MVLKINNQSTVFHRTAFGDLLRLFFSHRALKYEDEKALPPKWQALKDEYHSGEKGKTGIPKPHPDQEEEQSGDSDASEPSRSPSPSQRDSPSGLVLAPTIDPRDRDIAMLHAQGGHGAGVVTPQRSRGSDDTRVARSDDEKKTKEQKEAGEKKQKKEGGDKEKEQDQSRAEKDNKFLVEWDGPDDPENPENWSSGYKCFVMAQICLLTFAVYIGSAIYSAGIVGPNSISVEFSQSQVSCLVGLTLFILGYGIGPMLWSPMSEVPKIGRQPIYIATLFVFVALQFPIIFAKNFATILALRFVTGFFGSPALATGGATVGDMYSPKYRAYGIAVWGTTAVCGPTFGPLLGGFAFENKNWQWPIWILTWMSGFALIFLFFFFPETSGPNILHRKAVRLRRQTGIKELQSQSEIDTEKINPKEMVIGVLTKPIILFLEPVVLVLNLYIALIYGLLYAWLESFPIVFTEGYGFSPGLQGTAFLGIFIGTLLALAGFSLFCKYKIEPRFDKGDGPKPEERLPPATIGGIMVAISLFWFGAASLRTHWIVPIIGTSFFGAGTFLLFNSVLNYLPDAYPADAASILAGNDLMRSSFGAAFPLFSGAMYAKLGVLGATFLLAGLACVFVPIPFLLLKYGARIRKSSKRAKHDDEDENDKKGDA